MSLTSKGMIMITAVGMFNESIRMHMAALCGVRFNHSTGL